ncbi:hypothetical protein ABIB57_004366 [Devosia sp. UYZn731]|uniref:hypothetical protein n=1 Tax=Devosia sp. UYZn731 TaxID=3156345 RepID=UPI0033956374
MIISLRQAILIAALIAGARPSGAQEVTWSRYTDETVGFSAELPYGLFQPVSSEGERGITLMEVGGTGQINIYGGDAAGLTLHGFADRLSSGEQVRSVTYQAAGESWFVLSGLYEPEPDQEPLIFYTKVLLSRDRKAFSAFEVSYERVDKMRFDPIVSRIEDSFSRLD